MVKPLWFHLARDVGTALGHDQPSSEPKSEQSTPRRSFCFVGRARPWYLLDSESRRPEEDPLHHLGADHSVHIPSHRELSREDRNQGSGARARRAAHPEPRRPVSAREAPDTYEEALEKLVAANTTGMEVTTAHLAARARDRPDSSAREQSRRDARTTGREDDAAACRGVALNEPVIRRAQKRSFSPKCISRSLFGIAAPMTPAVGAGIPPPDADEPAAEWRNEIRTDAI